MWLLLFFLGLFTFIIYKLKTINSFWPSNGVQQLSSGGWKGELDIFLMRKILPDLDNIAYSQLGSGKFCGMMQMFQPVLLIKDLDLAKRILIKDFDHFVDRRAFGASQGLLKKMIMNLEGEEWKGVRNSMSPAFTTGKIRRMMEYFNKVGNSWVDHFKEDASKNGSDFVDITAIKEINRFTIEAIAAAGFGMNAEVIRNEDSHFFQMVKKLTTVSVVKMGFSLLFPKIFDYFKLSVMDEGALKYFGDLMEQGLKARAEGNFKTNDFIQLIVESRRGELNSGKDELSQFEKDAQMTNDVVGNEKKNYLMDDDIAKAQTLAFFFAGFSTTANIIGFVMYCLALNQEVQERLREEVNQRLFKGDNNDIDYDEVNKLVYMDMVVSEVIRKYPAMGRIERRCVKEYHLPEENLKIPKGTLVVVPAQSLHNDTDYFEHPSDFYPEHFSQENKAKRNPYAFLPFGSGPRNCIGMRFALVKVKTAVAHLLHNFNIEPSPKTPNPIKVACVGFGYFVPGDLELRLRLIKKNN